MPEQTITAMALPAVTAAVRAEGAALQLAIDELETEAAGATEIAAALAILAPIKARLDAFTLRTNYCSSLEWA